MTIQLNETERGLCEALAGCAEDMYRRLEHAVAIPTGRDYVQGIDQYRSWLRQRLEAIGATIELMPGEPRPGWLALEAPADAEDHSPVHDVMVASAGSDSGGEGHSNRVLIVGHLDTVHDPNGSFQTLQRCDDGRTATGPGAVDMKGGIELAMTVLETLHQRGVRIPWTVAFNADEETGSFQSHSVLRQLARRHDIGIVLEPALASGGAAIERMGSGQFRIDVYGRDAHVGREFDRGISAVTKLGEILIALSKMADVSAGRIVNVGPIVGGQTTNIVPDHAACRGNARFATPESGAELARSIDALATDATDMPRVEVRRSWIRPAKPCTAEVEAFAHLVQDIAAALGQELPLEKTGGVCDGNILQDEGLPTIDTLGIRGGNLHRTDEFIEVDSLVDRAQLLAIALLRISQPGSLG